MTPAGGDITYERFALRAAMEVRDEAMQNYLDQLVQRFEQAAEEFWGPYS